MPECGGYKKKVEVMNIHGIDFPDVMHPDSERYLRDILEVFSQDGDIDIRDSIAWRLLAGSLDQYFETEAGILEKGVVCRSSQKQESVSGYFTANIKLQTQIQNLLKELGLTPLSRMKLKKVAEAEEEPLLVKLLNRGRN